MKGVLDMHTWRRAVHAVSVLLVGFGCAGQEQPRRTPTFRPASGDELFVGGEYEAAKAAYRREELASRSPEDAARARVLHAFVQLAQQDTASAQEELRALEASTKVPHLWVRLARLLSHELARATVLHEAILDAGAELHALRVRIQQLEVMLEGSQEEVAAQQVELQMLKDERVRLQVTLREAEERAANHAARMRELESALEALKDIDMQREP